MDGINLTQAELINSLTAVIRALDNIEVKGRNNLSNLAGCIGVLESLAQKAASATDGVAEQE